MAAACVATSICQAAGKSKKGYNRLLGELAADDASSPLRHEWTVRWPWPGGVLWRLFRSLIPVHRTALTCWRVPDGRCRTSTAGKHGTTFHNAPGHASEKAVGLTGREHGLLIASASPRHTAWQVSVDSGARLAWPGHVLASCCRRGPSGEFAASVEGAFPTGRLGQRRCTFRRAERAVRAGRLSSAAFLPLAPLPSAPASALLVQRGADTRLTRSLRHFTGVACSRHP